MRMLVGVAQLAQAAQVVIVVVGLVSVYVVRVNESRIRAQLNAAFFAGEIPGPAKFPRDNGKIVGVSGRLGRRF